MGKGARQKGYIMNTDNGTVTPFLFNPSKYRVDRSFRYSEFTAPGVSYPKFQFVSGGAKEISVELYLYGVNGEPKQFINYLNDFYPLERSGVMFKKPPVMLFAFGSYIKKCIVTGFKEEYTSFLPNLAPKEVIVNLTLKVVV